MLYVSHITVRLFFSFFTAIMHQHYQCKFQLSLQLIRHYEFWHYTAVLFS